MPPDDLGATAESHARITTPRPAADPGHTAAMPPVDPVTLADYYDRHRSRIRAICARYLAEPAAAEDAVQEVFLRAARRLPSDPEMARRYLIGIARNVCREELRRGSGVEGLGQSSSRTGVVEVEEIAEAVSAADLLWRRLSMRDRLLVFHSFAGYSRAEIAERLQLSVKAVDMGLMRARQRARRMLDRVPALLAPLLAGRRRRRPRLVLRPPRLLWTGLLAVGVAAGITAAPWRLLLEPQLPSGASHLVAATTGGANVAGDRLSPAPDVTVTDLALAPGATSGRTAYAVVRRQNGCDAPACSRLVRSDDGGATWTALPARGFTGDHVLVAAGRRGTATILGTGWEGLQRSDDGGRTFRTVAAVTGPATMVDGRGGAIVAVVSPRELWLYDVAAGTLRPGPALPDRSSVVAVASLGSMVVVSALEPASGGRTARPVPRLLECPITDRCRTLPLHAAGALWLAPVAGVGDGAVLAFAGHLLYTLTPQGMSVQSVPSLSSDVVAAVAATRSSRGAISVLLALWWDDGTHAMMARSDDSGRTIGRLPGAAALASCSALVVTPDGHVLAATDGGLWRSTDGGHSWLRASL